MPGEQMDRRTGGADADDRSISFSHPPARLMQQVDKAVKKQSDVFPVIF